MEIELDDPTINEDEVCPGPSIEPDPTPNAMEDRFGWMMETEHLLYRFGEAVHIRTVIERPIDDQWRVLSDEMVFDERIHRTRREPRELCPSR